ncbi:hypothetical protein BO86DRAFT_94185 [Aspergillus japonicus CBS 114.51]|uniref:Uncharacterized protein n=1 Tax=Aspergillus japonicus CBS 114.51 TaxID=1448312 RepID=A0A8T8X114_ASPJA|nr:hypothetical protein BO86DRAFT_94185 [Aspergillus japonicus CBS 114.51]RAH81828.1 hypothetical protein BO86DRAFT_94185 [Aspergillus japonicus CBS 114.51]
METGALLACLLFFWKGILHLREDFTLIKSLLCCFMHHLHTPCLCVFVLFYFFLLLSNVFLLKIDRFSAFLRVHFHESVPIITTNVCNWGKALTWVYT